MRVLLCSYFKFPNGCAGAVRHEKMSQMIDGLGHEVLVVGIGQYNDFQYKFFKGIKYTSLRQSGSGFWSKCSTRLNYWKNLKKVLECYNPDCIIMDDMRPYVTIKLKKYVLSKGIILVHDSVEWYSRQQFKLNFFSPAFISKNIINRYLIDNKCRVIAISHYLKTHFEQKGIATVNIPIVIGEEDIVKDKSLCEKIRFTYAGQAGKKDHLNIMLEAMLMLSEEERNKFEFHILGCTKEQMIKNGFSQQTIQELGLSLVIYGRVSREVVFEVLKESDFTLLIRSAEQRYAKAGFPTKVVESLAHSTPVIANISSDLGEYLINGYNSLIVTDSSAENLAFVLKKAISLSLDQRMEMCRNAMDTASQRFHYAKFMKEMHSILSLDGFVL